MTARCRSCGAPIVWAHTVKGKRIPVEPADDGNLRLETHPDGTRTAHVEGGLLPTWPAVADRYRAHFATCPNADEHRRRT